MSAPAVDADLLAAWFPLRDELCDLRSRSDQSPADAVRIAALLTDLVDIVDDIIGDLVPDRHSGIRITGEAIDADKRL